MKHMLFFDAMMRMWRDKIDPAFIVKMAPEDFIKVGSLDPCDPQTFKAGVASFWCIWEEFHKNAAEFLSDVSRIEEPQKKQFEEIIETGANIWFSFWNEGQGCDHPPLGNSNLWPH